MFMVGYSFGKNRMHKLKYLLALLTGIAISLSSQVAAQTQATCTAYLASNPNPAGIPSVSGAGVAQRSAFLADGGKLVAIGSRYYTVSIPSKFYTATTPVVVFDLHGTGGYPEAEWNDWHASMADRGYAFISLAWGGGTPNAATDTEIYTQIKQIFQDVGASCPIANARKWLMGFSVGSAMSFAVMIRDVADQKIFRGQVAISGAAIGPLTTGKDVMHSTVEANRTNANAMLGIESWMYCGEMDLDHGWSMCLEMPNGESFVNDHSGRAVLYKDPSGMHHSLPTSATARNEMLDYLSSTSHGDWAIEFYNSGINHYFMTAYTDEATSLDNKPEWNWARTGKTFNVWLTQASALSNASPVCRFYGVFSNGTVGSHFYTVDATECAYVKSRLDWGWNYEGDAFYAVKPTGDTCPSGTSPVYRAYNNGMGGAPNHRYMTSQTEVDAMVTQGWVSEGTAFCGVQ